MTVRVRGRLEVSLRAKSILFNGDRRSGLETLAIAGCFLASALAPLSMTVPIPWVALRSLVLPTRTLPLVFPLTLITTVAGAVNFNV